MNPVKFFKSYKKSYKTIKRLDEDGSLYYMDYLNRYDSLFIKILTKLLHLFKKSGCSAFIRVNEKGEVITGRNYDMPHLVNGQLTSANLVIRCHGKYESINGADGMWLNKISKGIKQGCFDDGKTDLSFLYLLPFLCMDGINEKGLSVSILALDLKEGDKPCLQKVKGHRNVIITELVRYLLDECANIDEAIKYTEKCNMINTFGRDYHLFLSDESGKSCVFEWRNSEFSVTYNDICTNFYVGYDDACDCYLNGKLKEKFTCNPNTINKYRYGYGHGYDRFKTLDTKLDGVDVISEDKAKDLLSEVAQDFTGELTSYTQYSVLYNNTNKTATYWSLQDYKHSYTFSIE